MIKTLFSPSVEALGSQSAFARRAEISPPILWPSLKEGRPLPAELVFPAEAATGFQARSQAEPVPAGKRGGAIASIVNDDIGLTGSVALKRSVDPVAVFFQIPDGHRPFDPGASASIFDVRNAAADLDDRCLCYVGDELLELLTHSHTPIRILAPIRSRSDSTFRRYEREIIPLSNEEDTEGSVAKILAFPPKITSKFEQFVFPLAEAA